MSHLAGFVHRRPWVVIVAVIALTGLFIVGATRIKVSSGLREFYSQTDPKIRSLDRIDEAFGGSEYIMIAFPSERVFTPGGLRVLSGLSDSLGELDGVGRAVSYTHLDVYKRQLFMGVLGTLMIPGQITMIPVFLLLKKMGLLNTYSGLILPGIASAFGIFFMRQFIVTLPNELLELSLIHI